MSNSLFLYIKKMEERVKELIDMKYSEIETVQRGKWNKKVLDEMTKDARDKGEEEWHEEHEKCTDRIFELRKELAKTIWCARHMTMVAIKEWEEGGAFPKSYTKFEFPNTLKE